MNSRDLPWSSTIPSWCSLEAIDLLQSGLHPTPRLFAPSPDGLLRRHAPEAPAFPFGHVRRAAASTIATAIMSVTRWATWRSGLSAGSVR